MITVNISTELYNDLLKICAVTGRTPDDIIEEVVQREANQYRNENKEVVLQKGQVNIHNNTVKQSFINAGKQPPEDKWVDCRIIRRTTIFGAPYVVVLSNDNQICKIPAESVRLVTEDT